MLSRDPLTYFQDREDSIALFDSLWNEHQSRWILALAGMSGLGKSTLIEWLETNRCKAKKIPYSIVDFAIPREYKDLLDAILRHNGLKPHIPASSYQEYELKRDKILEDRVQGTSIVIKQQQIEGDSNHQEIKLDLVEVKHKLDIETRERLTDAWLACIGRLDNSQLVLFLDTFQTFQQDAPSGTVEWLWAILEETHKILPGLRIVVGSQQPVKANPRFVLREELKPFTFDISDTLLTQVGITDRDFRNAVYERLAKGHPLVTMFVADAWLKAQSIGSPIAATQVPSVGKLEEAVQWIQDMILAQLQEPLKPAVRWASLLRSFNLEVLNKILDLALNADQFRQLTTYSFIERAPEMLGWKCHDLLRGVQIDYLSVEQPQEFADFHRKASQFFEASGNTLEQLYHRFFFEPSQAFNFWMNTAQTMQSRFDFGESDLLFELIETVESRLNDLERASYLHMRGLHYLLLSEYVQAEPYLMQSIKLYQSAKRILGIANVQDSLGDLELARNNRQQARIYYNQAREAYLSIGNSNGAGTVNNALGRMELTAGNLKEAKSNFTLALKLIDKTNYPNNYANALCSLGDLNLFIENSDATEKSYEEALTLYRSTNNRRGQATVLRQLGQLLEKKGDKNSAQQYLREAITLFEETSSAEGSAVTYLILGDVLAGDIHSALENWDKHARELLECYDKAMDIFKRIGNKQGEADVYSSWGTLMYQKGKFKEAKDYYLLSYSTVDGNLSVRDAMNFHMFMVQVEDHLGDDKQAMLHYTATMDIAEKTGLRYTPLVHSWRRDFWTRILRLESESYLLSMRILDWLAKPSKKESEEYIRQLQATLLAPNAEKLLRLMFEQGPDKELLGYHLSLLRKCRKWGIEQAYTKLRRDIWDYEQIH